MGGAVNGKRSASKVIAGQNARHRITSKVFFAVHVMRHIMRTRKLNEPPRRTDMRKAQYLVVDQRCRATRTIGRANIWPEGGGGSASTQDSARIPLFLSFFVSGCLFFSFFLLLLFKPNFCSGYCPSALYGATVDCRQNMNNYVGLINCDLPEGEKTEPFKALSRGTWSFPKKTDAIVTILQSRKKIPFILQPSQFRA